MGQAHNSFGLKAALSLLVTSLLLLTNCALIPMIARDCIELSLLLNMLRATRREEILNSGVGAPHCELPRVEAITPGRRV
jgi:hypothetical protein